MPFFGDRCGRPDHRAVHGAYPGGTAQQLASSQSPEQARARPAPPPPPPAPQALSEPERARRLAAVSAALAAAAEKMLDAEGGPGGAGDCDGGEPAPPRGEVCAARTARESRSGTCAATKAPALGRPRPGLPVPRRWQPNRRPSMAADLPRLGTDGAGRCRAGEPAPGSRAPVQLPLPHKQLQPPRRLAGLGGGRRPHPSRRPGRRTRPWRGRRRESVWTRRTTPHGVARPLPGAGSSGP